MDSINAAKFLGRSVQTLADWRHKNKGPQWVRVGGRVFYYYTVLVAYTGATAAAE
jgi:hypothetical protein